MKIIDACEFLNDEAIRMARTPEPDDEDYMEEPMNQSIDGYDDTDENGEWDYGYDDDDFVGDEDYYDDN